MHLCMKNGAIYYKRHRCACSFGYSIFCRHFVSKKMAKRHLCSLACLQPETTKSDISCISCYLHSCLVHCLYLTLEIAAFLWWLCSHCENEHINRRASPTQYNWHMIWMQLPSWLSCEWQSFKSAPVSSSRMAVPVGTKVFLSFKTFN